METNAKVIAILLKVLKKFNIRIYDDENPECYISGFKSEADGKIYFTTSRVKEVGQ